ncbi:monooxygenase [Salinisphaera orenii]|uniref:monooxygenase n=1 Tax=Salinisphaera orenii TaxID=856731 RepID=UPI000DBE0CE7
MNTPNIPNQAGLTTEQFAQATGNRPGSIRTHLCERGSYYGIKPKKLPNGRLLWPPDAIERLLDAAES